MNKRQAKKKLKNENEIRAIEESLQFIIDSTPSIIEKLTNVVKIVFEKSRELYDDIKTMSDEEFEEFCKDLSAEQISAATKIRKIKETA